VTGKDLTIGIPAMLVAFEQVLFAISFHYTFRSREYHESEKPSARRMGIFRAALHAYNPYDLLYGMAHAVTLAFGGVGPRDNGEWRKPRGGRYGKIAGQETVHLEPMSGRAQPGRMDGGYRHGGYQAGESQPYLGSQSYQRPRSASQTYRPPPVYDLQASESARLYPSHSRSHSPEPSMDETKVRDIV
jgi:hypothetical protein